jgi:N-acetylmuramoyl-L-alanine amidase
MLRLKRTHAYLVYTILECTYMKKLRPFMKRKTITTIGALIFTFALAGSTFASSYIISPGDTMWSIAQKHGVSVDEIVAANNIQNANLIYPGQSLTIPGQATAPVPPASGGSGSNNSGSSGSGSTGGSYTVQPGDTLWSIASRNGVSVNDILAANAGTIPNQNLIYVGQNLSVPGSAQGGGSASPAPDPAPAPSANIPQLLHDTALQYGLDPALVKAVAWQESGWNQSAVSSAGAVGVMQIMPATGAWISTDLVGRPLDVRGSAADNIVAGVAYLEYLYRFTNGSETRTLASYYQGPNSVVRYGILPVSHNYVMSVQAIRSNIQTHGSPTR